MAARPRMPNAGDRAASAPSRLISRITSPFGQKSRSIADTYIELDDPHKQYSPGDRVTGSVNFLVLKAVKVTHLVVCLHGFVQVYKNPGAPPNDNHRAHLGSGRSKKSGEYFGNGFASLFEDEVVLCGDGRLGEGPYQFKFILEFPDRDLPSSIEFERGTISYMITATLTRPTTISPTVQWERPVGLVERIDISKLYPPKARTITLEPLARRNRARHPARKFVDPATDRICRKDDSDPNSNGRRGSQTSSSASARADGEPPPRSPTPSEISFESLGSASQQDSNATSGRHSDSGKMNGSKTSLTMKTITATVQTLTGGCLPGHTIPIRININHTKYMKSLYGVIITLYRQARVDMHPDIPLGPTEKGKESKYEDYYPKSLTGLGGLSLSGAGSSHVFRKDLAQVTLPLLVDPKTLTAEINGKIRVPEDAFPTISTVPGSMISFRYYIEVVLDIQGKLSSAAGTLGSLGGFAGSNSSTQGIEGVDVDRVVFSNFGTPIIDTASLRRDKGVVACTFEVIVGTQGSVKAKAEKSVQRSLSHEEGESRPRRSSPPDLHVQSPPVAQHHHEQPSSLAYTGTYYGADGYYPDWYENPGYDPEYEMYGEGAMYFPDDPPSVPFPPPTDEPQLSEKAMLQQMEASVLPSHPPLEEVDEEQFNRAGSQPTAPILPDEHDGSANYPLNFSMGPIAGLAGPSRNSRTTGNYGSVADQVPAYEHHQHGPETVTDPTGHGPALPPGTFHIRVDGQTGLGASAPSLAAVVEAETSTVTSGELGRPSPNDDDISYTDVNDSHGEASASLGLPRYEK